MRPKLAFALLCVIYPSFALAQPIFTGWGSFAQFRGASGLPGSMAGVDLDGGVGRGGALTLSTPIGMSLAPDRMVWGISGLSKDSRFRMVVREDENDVNGHAWVIRGFRLGDQRLTLGISWISGLGEHVIAAQWQLPLPHPNALSKGEGITPTPDRQRYRVSVGIQDLTNSGNGGGVVEDTNSYYVAGTVGLGPAFVTAGIGTLRFSRGFASASAPVMRGLTGMVEHDGFGFNYGLGIDLDQTLHLFLGSVKGRYAVLSGMITF